MEQKPGPEPTQADEGCHLPYAGMTPTGSMGMISAPPVRLGAPRDAAKLEQIRNFLLLSGGNFAPYFFLFFEPQRDPRSMIGFVNKVLQGFLVINPKGMSRPCGPE